MRLSRLSTAEHKLDLTNIQRWNIKINDFAYLNFTPRITRYSLNKQSSQLPNFSIREKAAKSLFFSCFTKKENFLLTRGNCSMNRHRFLLRCDAYMVAMEATQH